MHFLAATVRSLDLYSPAFNAGTFLFHLSASTNS